MAYFAMKQNVQCEVSMTDSHEGEDNSLLGNGVV
jgi:hypothetical protein